MHNNAYNIFYNFFIYYIFVTFSIIILKVAAFAFWPLEGVKRCDDVLLPRIPFVFWFVSERGLVRELSLHLSRVFLEVVEMDDMCKQRAPRPTPSVWAVIRVRGLGDVPKHFFHSRFFV